MQRDDDQVLNFLIRLVKAHLRTGVPYTEGGLMQQPYFLVNYVQPWVQEAMDEARKVNDLMSIGQGSTFVDAVRQAGSAQGAS